MSPTGVRLKVVRERLDLAEECVAALRALPAGSFEEFLADPRNAPAADSHLRRGIEALFDTARHLLAKGYGMGALEYREIARACSDKGLVSSPDLAAKFRHIAGFRNRLIHYYDEVTPEELFGLIHSGLEDLEALCRELRAAGQRLTEGG